MAFAISILNSFEGLEHSTIIWGLKIQKKQIVRDYFFLFLDNL